MPLEVSQGTMAIPASSMNHGHVFGVNQFASLEHVARAKVEVFTVEIEAFIKPAQFEKMFPLNQQTHASKPVKRPAQACWDLRVLRPARSKGATQQRRGSEESANGVFRGT